MRFHLLSLGPPTKKCSTFFHTSHLTSSGPETVLCLMQSCVRLLARLPTMLGWLTAEFCLFVPQWGHQFSKGTQRASHPPKLAKKLLRMTKKRKAESTVG